MAGEAQREHEAQGLCGRVCEWLARLKSRKAGRRYVGEGDFPKQLAVIPSGFSIDFVGNQQVKVANGNHMTLRTSHNYPLVQRYHNFKRLLNKWLLIKEYLHLSLLVWGKMASTFYQQQ